jgi:chromosome segregation ATPase
MFARIKVYLIMFAAFAAFAGVFYWYYQDTQKALQQYARNQASLESALSSQKSATDALQRDITVMNTTLSTLNDDFTQSRQRVKTLEAILANGTDGRGLDVGERAVEDPQYIQKEINTGTEEVFNCFEILSGQENTNETDSKYINCLNAIDNNRMQ